MKSHVARKLRALSAEESSVATIQERLALVESLLEDSVNLTAAIRGLTREQALDFIAASHNAGRRPSVLNRP